jgi:predicted RNA-binding protein with PIN domain
MLHDGMTIHFARRHSDADEMIEDLLEQCAAPRSLVVVSSDHRVQRAARHRGASFVDSDKWYAELRAARREPEVQADDVAVKQADATTPEDLAYWLGEFSDSPQDDTSANPFPPGYADDVQQDE